MLEEHVVPVRGEGRSTPWGWLRGFAWFLVAWPAMSLLAAKELQGFEWEMILLATLGPAGIGLVLLGLERGLTRVLGKAASRRQPVPSTLRDVSNLGITMAVLMGIDIVLVSVFEDPGLFARADLDPGPMTARILTGCFGVAVVFRLAHRLVHGPSRVTDLGEAFGTASGLLRLLGYLALIPTLFVCMVMIDYTLRGQFDYFGLAGWTILPAILFLGLRSAMAPAPRFWARDPWEAWRREQSLALPWWGIAWVLGMGCGVMFVGMPFGVLPDDEITMAGRVIVGILLGPIGLLILWLGGKMTVTGLRDLARSLPVSRALSKNGDLLEQWHVRTQEQRVQGSEATETVVRDVLLRLRDGREAPFGASEGLIAWLERRYPRR